jgi:hypothetical protein
MKSIVRPICGITLAIIILFVAVEQMFGQDKPEPQQDKISVSLGIGLLDALNLGCRYQFFKKSQIGLSIGTWPSPNDWLFNWKSLISLSGDFYYHFGRSTELSVLPPWYVRPGLDYIRIGYGSDYAAEDNLECHFRFGRDFNFSENIGISLDVGVLILMLNETDFTPYLPSMGISIFVRLFS